MLKINSKIPLFAMLVSLLFISCARPKINQEMLSNYIVDSQSKECIQCRVILPKIKSKNENRWSGTL